MGIAGRFLPFLQGLLIILVGVVILSSEYAWARLLMTKLRKRFPRVGRIADQAAVKASTFLRRFSRHPDTD